MADKHKSIRKSSYYIGTKYKEDGFDNIIYRY